MGSELADVSSARPSRRIGRFQFAVIATALSALALVAVVGAVGLVNARGAVEAQGAVAGSVSGPDGDFDFVLFQDGSYYIDGTQTSNSAEVIVAYSADSGTSATWVAPTADEPAFEYTREGVPPAGPEAHHGFRDSVLGLRWVTAIDAASSGQPRDAVAVTGTIDSDFGLPTSWTVTSVEEGTGDISSSSSQILGLEAYRGPGIDRLLARVPVSKSAAKIEWGYAKAADARGKRAAIFDPLGEHVPPGWTLASVWEAQDNAESPDAVIYVYSGPASQVLSVTAYPSEQRNVPFDPDVSGNEPTRPGSGKNHRADPNLIAGAKVPSWVDLTASAGNPGQLQKAAMFVDGVVSPHAWIDFDSVSYEISGNVPEATLRDTALAAIQHRVGVSAQQELA